MELTHCFCQQLQILCPLHRSLNTLPLAVPTEAQVSSSSCFHHLQANMSEVKPVSTPMASSPKLTLILGDPLCDPTPFHKLIGSIQYLQYHEM